MEEKKYKVGDKVSYDNFGVDFHSEYTVKEVTQFGYILIDDNSTEFFAYEYQIRLIE